MVVDGAYYRALSKPKGQQACSVLLCKTPRELTLEAILCPIRGLLASRVNSRGSVRSSAL